MIDDLISRQAAIGVVEKWFKKIGLNPDICIDGLISLPSAQPEIIRCKDCVYFDPPHIVNKGVRYEYEDMPEEAFDELGTGFVNNKYGINVGGRCCRDYQVGYAEDKRVYVSKNNYCGRAGRKNGSDR